MKRPHLDLENMPDWCQFYIVMLLLCVHLLSIKIAVGIWGLTPSVYMVWLSLGIILWKGYDKKVKPKDKSLLYLIAVFFSSGTITVTNLSLEELQEMIGKIPISDYAYIKVMSNFFGWVFLPTFAIKLTNLAKNEETKLRPSRYRNNRSFYKKSAMKKARRQQRPM